MNHEAIISLINANIRQNGKGEITGKVMNAVLKAMVAEVGRGYAYMGIADTGTMPVEGDTPVFYLATQPGVYTNFEGLEVGGISLLRWSDRWEADLLGVEQLISDAVTPVADEVRGKYAKPSTGIPKTDLDASVQASLDKADTALQEHQSLDGYATETYVDAKVADVEVDIPTKVSELTNDSGYLTPDGLKTINGESIVGEGDITISGGGTSDYTDLQNKPKIGGVELNGNKSASELGLYTSAEAAELTEGIATTFMNYNRQNAETFATKVQTGDNANLKTYEKENLVGAINEVVAYAVDVNSKVSDNADAIVNLNAKFANYYTKSEVDNLIVSTINSSF